MAKLETSRYLVDNSTEISLVYHWAAGTVPPPYHEEYEIRITGEAGILEFWPGYPGEGVESQQSHFKVEPLKWAELKAIINNISEKDWVQNNPPHIGGEQEWLSAGAGVQIPADLVAEEAQVAGEIFMQVRELVPDEVWGTIRKEQ
jgi:hypothetical protein